MYKHILISTDGSAVAQAGVEHRLSLANSLGAKVTVITVTERFPVFAGAAAGWAPGPTEMFDYDASQKDAAEAVLAIVKAAAEKLILEVETLHVPDAQPAEAIVEAAR